MTTEIICVKCLDKEKEIIKLREALEELHEIAQYTLDIPMQRCWKIMSKIEGLGIIEEEQKVAPAEEV